MNFDELFIANKIKGVFNSQYLFNQMENFIEPNKNFTMHPKENFMFEMMGKDPVDDLTVDYKYNNRGFRSDDFTNVHTKKHILFSGCSEGEGIASPLNTMWNKIVYDFLNVENDCSGFFNVAIDNFGFHKVIFNVINYISEYGKPDKLILLLPDSCRFNQWDTNSNSYLQVWANPNELKEKIDQENFMNSVIDFIPFMKLFESYCDSSGIELLWSTWSYLDGKVFSMLDTFKYFFEMDYSLETNVDKSKQIRRDGHQGEYYHSLWAQNFIRNMQNVRS
jgi:hypothetical protein